ncbi:DUF4160 domain-containing protein [Treponema sp.]|uniref:DUF4160 domain-containing protein n=1 Tax=Treponema sp. TaxID=166 RepID=UPI0039A31853
MEPCHVHVRKSGKLAKLWISDIVSVADNIGFSAKEISELLAIAEDNMDIIKEAWNEFFKGKC